jgi:hypothetical protein
MTPGATWKLRVSWTYLGWCAELAYGSLGRQIRSWRGEARDEEIGGRSGASIYFRRHITAKNYGQRIRSITIAAEDVF